jgi:hypothetical protein
MILVIGAKGSVGATTFAAELVGLADAIGLDLADGQLAGRLDRATWTLSPMAYATPAARRDFVDRVVRRRMALLWTPECALSGDKVWSAVRDVDNRVPVIADAGIEPPPGAPAVARAVVIVTADLDVARWHTRRLQARFPGAIVVEATKEAALEVADRLLGN